MTQCPKAERDLAMSVDLSDALTTAILVLTKDEARQAQRGVVDPIGTRMGDHGRMMQGVGSRTARDDSLLSHTTTDRDQHHRSGPNVDGPRQ